MQRAQLDRPQGYHVRVVILVIVSLAAAVLQVAWTATASAATLDRVRQTGKLTLGYRTDARPFSYKDESGNPDGYAVSLCKNVAEKMKSDLGLPDLAVEWVPVTGEDQFKAVQESKVDLLCGAADTLASRKDVDFSIPIFPGGIGALLRADAPVGLKEVLSGPTRRRCAASIRPATLWASVARLPCASNREAGFLGRRRHTQREVGAGPT